MQRPWPSSGTDIVSLKAYSVRELRFYAKFTGGNNSHSSDEMVVFCTDTLHYNGTEYGVRYMLDGDVIYGYTQTASQTFVQVPLVHNDGAVHHYEVVVQGSTVTFLIDGWPKGSLDSYDDSIYGAYTYWLTVAVHRYSPGWSSSGYNSW